jgi:hypothetical protein
MIDHLYSLWQVCHGHDNVGSPEFVSTNVYSPSNGFYGWNTPMHFQPMSDENWAEAARRSVRPRDVHDGPAWGVTYDAGTFANNPIWLEVCAMNQFNASWFRVASTQSDPSPNGFFAPNEDPFDVDDQSTTLRKRGANPSPRRKAVSDSELERLENEYRSGRMSTSEFAQDYAQRSCEMKQNPCLPAWDYEKCTPNEVGPETELDYFLNKLGVHNATCLQRIRRNMYPWIQRNGGSDASKTKQLLSLCNGFYDGIC